MERQASNIQTWIPDFGQAQRVRRCDRRLLWAAPSKQGPIKRVLRHGNLVLLDFLVEGTAGNA